MLQIPEPQATVGAAGKGNLLARVKRARRYGGRVAMQLLSV